MLGEWFKMVKEEEDEQEVLYLCRMIVIKLIFRNEASRQRRTTGLRVILSFHISPTEDKGTLTAEVQGFDWKNERINMTTRFAYPYPGWVNGAFYPEGYQIPRFIAYSSEGCPRRCIMRFLAQRGNTNFVPGLL